MALRLLLVDEPIRSSSAVLLIHQDVLASHCTVADVMELLNM